MRRSFEILGLALHALIAYMQCTDEEIAAWFNVSTRTIERRRKVVGFNDVMDRHGLSKSNGLHTMRPGRTR